MEEKWFTLNEALKEKLVLEFGATKAITTFYPKGVPIIPDPFYETIVNWPKKLSAKKIDKIAIVIFQALEEMNELVQTTEGSYETALGKPQIVWAHFPPVEEQSK